MALRVLLLIIFLQYVFAIPGEAGREHALFSLGHGARAMALGSAFVAHEPDVASLYWNPGALGYLTQREVATLHAGLPTDASYFYLGGVYPTPLAQFAASWEQLQMTDIPQTTTLNADNEVEIERYLTYTETAAIVGAGRALTEQLAFGVSLKTLTKALEDHGDGHGVAGTAGLFYRFNPSLNIGLVVDNVSSTLRYDSGYIENVPALYRVGLAYQLDEHWCFSFDLDRRAESASFMRGHAGVEYQLTSFAYLAGGYDVDRFTVGAGFSLNGIYAQYAFLAENRYSPGAEQFVTLGVRW